MTDHPLLAPWTGPHGGFPQLHAVTAADLRVALLAGMADRRAAVAAIAASTEPPTFASTFAALEDAGRPLVRAMAVFDVYKSTMSDDDIQALDTELAPMLSALHDEVTQNAALYARLTAAAAASDHAGEPGRLMRVVLDSFARKGAGLGDDAKARLAAINAELATLYTRFSHNLLADEEDEALVLTDEAELAGLPESERAAAAEAALAHGAPGTWRIANTRSAIEPFLTYAVRRDLRERAWRMWVGRGEHAGERDNRPIIAQLVALRAERAGLLGFASHAHWTIADNMARTPEAAMALMMRVWPAAAARAREEIADMQRLADAEGAGHAIAAWDYRYYAEKVRKAKYDLDQAEVRPYLQLDKMREAMMWAAGELFGFRFAPIDVPVCHPDVTAYEVTRGGERVGLWYFDPFARAGKQSGAWMSEYRTQETFRGVVTPIVSNNANFMPAKGAVLISWDDAQTLFHEFGHALHGLCSRVAYPTLAGTGVLRDFVEFPSQLFEHWLRTPEVLTRFAVHVETGEPIPAALVAKIERARHCNEGFRTVEYLTAAIYDLKIHTEPTMPIDPAALEQRVLAELECPPEIVMRHRPAQFAHVFSGDDYSAGYYAYLWADTLTADAAEAFAQTGSFYDPATARRLHDAILAVGNAVPADEAFRAFRGREVDSDALMRSRGFPVAAAG